MRLMKEECLMRCLSFLVSLPKALSRSMVFEGKDGAAAAEDLEDDDGRAFGWMELVGVGFGREAEASFARIPTRFLIGAWWVR